MDKESKFFNDNEESASLKREDLSNDTFADWVQNDVMRKFDELAKKQETEHQETVQTSPRQRIVIKKLLCGSNHIREVGMDDDDAVKIPDGWNVKQITTTPIEKGGATTHLALTMLLEKAD